MSGFQRIYTTTNKYERIVTNDAQTLTNTHYDQQILTQIHNHQHISKNSNKSKHISTQMLWKNKPNQTISYTGQTINAQTFTSRDHSWRHKYNYFLCADEKKEPGKFTSRCSDQNMTAGNSGFFLDLCATAARMTENGLRILPPLSPAPDNIYKYIHFVVSLG